MIFLIKGLCGLKKVRHKAERRHKARGKRELEIRNYELRMYKKSRIEN
jgi:hypothetical protein